MVRGGHFLGILAIAAVLAVCAQPAFAVPAYDATNGYAVYRCGDLDVAGVTYNLNQSISTTNSNCITVKAGNFYFYGNGYTISGDNYNNVSGFITDQYSYLKNITIVDVVIYNFRGVSINFIKVNESLVQNVTISKVYNGEGTGVYTNGISYNNTFLFNRIVGHGHGVQNDGNYSRFINNTFSDNLYALIMDHNSSNCLLINNTINNSFDRGISLQWGALFNIVKYNTITRSGKGIEIASGASGPPTAYNTISNNSISFNTDGIVFTAGNGSSNLITNNTIFNNTGKGISVYGNNNIIDKNNIYYCGSNGIYFSSGSNNTILYNVISKNTGNGISIPAAGYYNIIVNNTIQNNSQNGITSSGYSNTIQYNTIIDHGINNMAGIALSGAINETVNNNTILRNRNGIYLLTSAQKNTVSKNYIEDFSYKTSGGIWFSGSNPTSFNNRIINNTVNGFYNSIKVDYKTMATTFDGGTLNGSTNAAVYSYLDTFYNNTFMNIRITPSAGQNALWIRGHSANNTFTNVSYTAAENINTTGNITRGWYIDAYVNDTAGTPISGAQVLMINSTGNVSIGTTGSDGYIRLYPAMAYISNSTKLKFYPYWFSVVGRSNTTNNSVNWDVGGDGNYVDGQKGKVAITVSYVAPPDTTPPVVNVSHYPSGTIYAGSYVNMTATANDSGTGNSGISEIKIYVDGQLNRTCSSSPCTTQDYAYSVGTHTYYATANDSSANQNQGRDPSAGTKSFEVLAIPAEVCTDMADNDFDTYVDCADSDCFSSPSCQQQPGSQSNSTPGFEAGILAALSASFAAFAIYRKKT